MINRCECGHNQFVSRTKGAPLSCVRCGAVAPADLFLPLPKEETEATLDDVVQRLDRIIELLTERRNER